MMAGRFVGTPEIPDAALLDWQAVLFSAIKENVDLLTGTRGEADLASRAVVRGDLTVAPVGQQDMITVSAKGQGFTISGSDVASLADFARLIADVQNLANDLYATRQALDLLIQNLKGR